MPWKGRSHRLATALGAHDDLALIIHNASAFEPRLTSRRHNWNSSSSLPGAHGGAISAESRAGTELARQHNASIIHITDIYIHAPAPQFAAYAATKAGAHSLAMSFARELAPAVRVNTI